MPTERSKVWKRRWEKTLQHGKGYGDWGRVTHICVGKLTIIGSDNGLSPGRRQAIIWTNTGILLIWPLGTNFSEILIAIETFSFKKMHFKISSAKWRPFCLGLNVLTRIFIYPLKIQSYFFEKKKYVQMNFVEIAWEGICIPIVTSGRRILYFVSLRVRDHHSISRYCSNL